MYQKKAIKISNYIYVINTVTINGTSKLWYMFTIVFRSLKVFEMNT